MKRVIIASILLLLLAGCAGFGRFHMMVDGEYAYIKDVNIQDGYVILPLNKCLLQLGAEYLESPYNKYHRTCLKCFGERYIKDDNNRLFAKEDVYMTLEQENEKRIEKYSVSEYNLIPYYQEKHKALGKDYISWGEGSVEIYVGNNAFVQILSELGCRVTVEWDAEEQMVYISSISQNPEDG